VALQVQRDRQSTIPSRAEEAIAHRRSELAKRGAAFRVARGSRLEPKPLAVLLRGNLERDLQPSLASSNLVDQRAVRNPVEIER
jgi:hypothetical protein